MIINNTNNYKFIIGKDIDEINMLIDENTTYFLEN